MPEDQTSIQSCRRDGRQHVPTDAEVERLVTENLPLAHFMAQGWKHHDEAAKLSAAPG